MQRLAFCHCTGIDPKQADAFWDTILNRKPRRLRLLSRRDAASKSDFFFVCLQEDSQLVEEVWAEYRPDSHADRTAQARQECYWSPREIEEAELLRVKINRTPAGTWNWERCRTLDFQGTQTDLPLPWGWQITPLLLNKSQLPRSNHAIAQACEFLVIHQSLVDTVAAMQDTSVVHRAILDRKTGKELGWFQLGSQHRLPAFANGTTGVITDGPNGPNGQPGHFHTMREGFQIALLRTQVVKCCGKIPDIAFTTESFGYWSEPHEPPRAASPELVVSQSVRRQLVHAGASRLSFEPVLLID